MNSLFSNQLKALLVMDDITEDGISIWQDNCFTVQHFCYECQRDRNSFGIPYGATVPAYLDFTVRIATGNDGKVLYQRMYQNASFPFSFLFNASFNELRRFSSCEDAMIATGYVIGLDESYSTRIGEEGQAEQMLLHVRLLLCNIAYLGRERILKLTVTND